MPFNDVCSKSRIRKMLLVVTVGLCLFSMADAKPRAFKTRPKPSKLALGVGLETGAASHSAEEEIQPTIALRASLSLVQTVRRELFRGLPTRWIGVYGRLQNDFDDGYLRTAAGLTTGFLYSMATLDGPNTQSKMLNPPVQNFSWDLAFLMLSVSILAGLGCPMTSPLVNWGSE